MVCCVVTGHFIPYMIRIQRVNKSQKSNELALTTATGLCMCHFPLLNPAGDLKLMHIPQKPNPSLLF